MTLRRFVWHPIIVFLAMLGALWEFFVAPNRSTPFDLFCAPLMVAWIIAVGILYRREGTL